MEVKQKKLGNTQHQKIQKPVEITLAQTIRNVGINSTFMHDFVSWEKYTKVDFVRNQTARIIFCSNILYFA